MIDKYSIREANIHDVSSLVQHHCIMCDETNALAGVERDINIYKELEISYKNKLDSEINKSCKAWVAEFENKIVASGVIWGSKHLQ